MKISSAIGLIFYSLFVLLVGLAGLVCAFFVLVTALSGPKHSLGVFLVSTIVFVMATRNLLRGVIASRKERAINAQLKEANAEKAWLWRDDWASGNVICSNLETVRQAWGLTSVWFLVFAPVVLLTPNAIEKSGHPLLFKGLYIFAVLGALFLVSWAIRNTHRWKKFGRSVFEMVFPPFQPGGHVAGVVRLNTHLVPEDGFEVILRCIRVTRGHNQNAQVRVHVLWEDSHTVEKHLDDVDPAKSAIPVFFLIPAEQPESNSEEYHESTVWQLQVHAKISGMDYSAQFTLPVYKTSDADIQILETPPWKYPMRETDSRRNLEKEGVIIRPASGDSTEVVFPAGRNTAAITKQLALTIGVAALATLFFLPGQGRATLFFGIVMALAVLFNAWLTLRLWLLKGAVRLSERNVVIAAWMFGDPKAKAQIPAKDVRDIEVVSGWERGSGSYYDIQLHYIVTKKGSTGGVPRHIKAGSGIRCRKDAEWLAEKMMEALGNPGSQRKFVSDAGYR